MRYYPARLARTYDNAMEALIAVGATPATAQQIIDRATISQSPAIFASIDSERAIVLTDTDDGRVQLWEACVGLVGTQEEARDAAAQINAGLPKPSTWAVFEWREPVSRTRN